MSDLKSLQEVARCANSYVRGVRFTVDGGGTDGYALIRWDERNLPTVVKTGTGSVISAYLDGLFAGRAYGRGG